MFITTPDISVTATIGTTSLSVYGYGPVDSSVTLKGFGVSEVTMSDNTGLFRFNAIYSFTYKYPELCIQAVDSEKRATQPTCIPGLPNNSIIPLEVGPILLSPTLSLTANSVEEGGIASMTGKTTPDTLVNVYLSKQNEQKKLSLVNSIHAYTLPILNTRSDASGEYEVSLPTGDRADYKIFTSTKFGDDFSAKSTTLSFSVISVLKSFFERLIAFILLNKIRLLIVVEIIVFIILFLMALKSTTRRKKRHTEKDYLEELRRI